MSSKERQGEKAADLADCGLVGIVNTFEGDVLLSQSVEPESSIYARHENNAARG